VTGLQQGWPGKDWWRRLHRQRVYPATASGTWPPFRAIRRTQTTSGLLV